MGESDDEKKPFINPSGSTGYGARSTCRSKQSDSQLQVESHRDNDTGKVRNKYAPFVCTSLLLVLILSVVLSLTRLGLLISLVIDRFGDEHPATKVNLLQSEFSYLMEILVQLGHALEGIALITGVGIVLWQPKEPKCYKIMRDGLEMSSSCKTAAAIALIIFVILLTVVFTTVAPICRNVWINETVHSYNDSPKIGRAYAVLAIFTHITNAAIASSMVIATALIMKMWHWPSPNQDETSQSGQYATRQSSQGENHRSASNQNTDPLIIKQFSSLITGYSDTGNAIAVIQTIYEGWCVAVWITYFFRITMDATATVKSITENGYHREEISIGFVAAHLFSYTYILVITYVCGQLMNKSHKEYYKWLQKKQKEIMSGKYDQTGSAENGANQAEDDKNESEETRMKCAECDKIKIFLQYSPLIVKEPDYQFLPSFCGFSIPLDNLGYLVTVSLGVFAIIATVNFDFAHP